MRGCRNPVPKACTCRPAGTSGFSPALQPLAGSTFIGGNKYWCGSGKFGFAPYCALGSPAFSSHAASVRTEAKTIVLVNRQRIMPGPPQFAIEEKYGGT